MIHQGTVGLHLEGVWKQREAPRRIIPPLCFLHRQKCHSQTHSVALPRTQKTTTCQITMETQWQRIYSLLPCLERAVKLLSMEAEGGRCPHLLMHSLAFWSSGHQEGPQELVRQLSSAGIARALAGAGLTSVPEELKFLLLPSNGSAAVLSWI